jgi:transcriptional regulator with XRE-family HTH domain
MSELKKIRTIDLGISQFELSQKSGVHPSRISLLENGLRMPTMNETKRISEALGMLPEEIFGPDAVMKRLTASRKKEP